MTGVDDIGREPVQFFELEQPRCGLRWGVDGCNGPIVRPDADNSEDFGSTGTANLISNDATLSVISGGVNVSSTGSNPYATQTGVALDGDGYRYVIVRGRVNAIGDGYEWRAYYGSGAGLPAPDRDMYAMNLAALELLEAGDDFVAYFDAADSTNYATDWRGETVDRLRLDVASGAAADWDLYDIHYTDTDPQSISPCYLTFTTCNNRENYSETGSIKWLFSNPTQPRVFDFGDHSDPDDLTTHPLPMLQSVSTAKTSLNIGGILTGKSPFGVRSQISANFSDMDWDDIWGDPHKHLRSNQTVAGFWAKWGARNDYMTGMYCTVYDGYMGQSLGDMQRRRYAVQTITGPNSSGAVSLTGQDPLRFADDDRAKFPRETAIELVGDIDDETTSIVVYASEVEDLSDSFGNTAQNFIRIDDEIIRYNGYSATGNLNEYSLNNVNRGWLGTEADEHDDETQVSRVGRFYKIRIDNAAKMLIEDYTETPSSFINSADWEAEGGTYLSSFIVTVTIPEATPVRDLVGECCQQGMFYLWWDEYADEIKMQAVRPPTETPITLDDSSNLIVSSLTRSPNDQVSRTYVYYGERNPIEGTEPDNFKYVRGWADGDVETGLDGERTRTVYGRWITTASHALQVANRIVSRYGKVPKFLSVTVDAKDRSIRIGDVADVMTRNFVDQDGNKIAGRWKVISAEELQTGHTYRLNMQTYEYEGLFAVWMENDAPDYDDATDAEKTHGFWWADDDGKMPDGTEGYGWQ